ncbi:lysozyme inhibitor LprI family protein [Chelativorans sp. Marseille-P2723]|uniref:lysozyme inhibitor LprI family protein n=1 Tax=Chelativorans sp. Marseille-P2723 TaxID=2709133 RepID=UPI0015707C94|nr:lysozyme inhibitor LprI family protein [Chelativorans sp. Marseille-P2723]
MRWIFIFAVTALAHATPSYASDACEEATDTATMLACINRDLSVADDQLNALYGALLGKVRHWDRADDAEVGFEIRLRQSQRAWVSFRDAECAFRGSVMEGGSAQPLIENGCRVALTKERNVHLKELLDMF